MLESTDTLWRYMKLGTLLALLVKKQAWFPSVHALRAGDPFEGSLAEQFHIKLWSALESAGHGVEVTKEWLNQHLPADMQRFLNLNQDYPGLSGQELGRAYFEAIAERRAVWCWYASEIESAAMWTI